MENSHRNRICSNVAPNYIHPGSCRQLSGSVIAGQLLKHDKVFEYWTNAVKLGDVRSHYHLGYMYYEGEGVEKDEEKGISHYEKAAIGGHPVARHNLAYHEGKNGNIERAVKHLIINAKLGDEDSMKGLWKFYSLGYITKKDLDVTLRGHQAAINATKSEQREAAAEAAKPLYDGS